MKNIILNNGIEMPQHGFGTYMIPKELLSLKHISWGIEHLIRHGDIITSLIV